MSRTNGLKSSRGPRPLEGDVDEALKQSIKILRPFLRRLARVLALGDRDVADDLYQLAITHLWRLDPTRFDDRNLQDWVYMRTSLLNHMRNALSAKSGNPRPLAV